MPGKVAIVNADRPPCEQPGLAAASTQRFVMSEVSQPEGRIAAIDYGTVRIGVALSNASRTIASKYEMYAPRAPEKNDEYFRKLGGKEGDV